MDRMPWTNRPNSRNGRGSGGRGRGNRGGGPHHRTSPAAMVGTEAIASHQLAKNQTDFRYPATGFCTKIEYSLLYSMMSRPDIYPVTVVKDAIRVEDFAEYLWIVPPSTRPAATGSQTTEGSDYSSYAQLCAILALAADKWPPPPMMADGTTNNDLNIVLILCKALIHCVVRHAEEHDLDREREVSELLEPLERVTLAKGRQTALAAVLPAYLGLGASILTGGNPIPFWIGYAMSINAVANQERDLANFRDIATTTTRQAHPETASLLTDDADD